MKTHYVYPGTFCPPTFGHLDIALRAARIFPRLTIICSKNDEKEKNWFTPDECKDLWQHYEIPKNIEVMTLAEFKTILTKNDNIIMIRGLRDVADFETEKQVMFHNHLEFKINNFFYIFGDEKHQNISSSTVRKNIVNFNLESLAVQISPLVATACLEKILNAKNIFMVVGRPGGGKSTFLKMLEEIDKQNYHINTDNFNHQLKPLLKKIFGEEDLFKIAITNEASMKKIIATPWLSLLSASLKSSPTNSNIFVEIPYGLQADKLMFRFIGGKVIYIGCGNKTENKKRIIARGTPQLLSFIDKIPDKKNSQKIIKHYRLSANYINTDCPLSDLFEKAKMFNNLISGGQKNVYNF